jgi:hypothetical protein
LRLILEDQYETPIANAPCILTLGSDSRHVTTDDSGQIEEDIPPDIHDAALVIQDAQTPLDNTRIAIRIGDLDPVTEISGQVARLNNLGYFAGDIKSPDHVAVESAVEEFRCDNNLTVDGVCGPKTQASSRKFTDAPCRSALAHEGNHLVSLGNVGTDALRKLGVKFIGIFCR